MAFFGALQEAIIFPAKSYLSDDEWYGGLEELCPIERPDIKNPGRIKPLRVSFYRVEAPVSVAEVEAAKLGRGFLNLFQVVGHLILHNRSGRLACWLGSQASDGTNVYLRMLMPNPASPKQVSYVPFMAALDWNRFGLACCSAQDELREDDLLLYAA